MSKAVKKVALVAAGAALGFVTGGIGFALIGGAVGLFVGSQQGAALKAGGTSSEPSAQTVRSSKAPARFILGRVSTGGVLVWAQEQTGSQSTGEWVHLVYVLSEGAIDALEAVYLGEEDISTYGANASYQLIVNPTQVNAFLKANCRDWRSSQIGRGLSFVRVSLKHDPEKFPSGIPDARFVVRGRNDLYDPRIGRTRYSENTALHLLWYLRERCKVPDDEIIFETFASAANVCDEAVVNADGRLGTRYRTGCVIGADEQRTQVIQKLEESCAGQLIRVGGKWMLQAGAYYGPADFEITEDMVIGTVSGSTEVTNDAAINIVTGTFIDPSQAWAETDFPEVRVQQWIVEDGGEAPGSISLGYVSDAYQAQRLANIKLRRARAGGSLQLPMNFAGYNCRPGRVVKVNLPSLNIVGEFIVTDWNMAPEDGCNVTVSQYEPAIFDDAVGKPYDPIGFINLPTGGLGSPTGLAWSTHETAEISQGVLSWVSPFGIVNGYAVTVRQGARAVQAHQIPATAVQLELAGLPSGSYTMSVAALGPLTRSGEASITVNINGPAVPEACAVQATIDTITLFPSNVQHGLNGGTYEYFFSMDPLATAGQAAYLGQGLSLTHTALAFSTNYFYFIRSRNAYGVSGFLKVIASTSTDVTTMLAAIAGKIGESELGEELLKEIEKISGDGPGSVNDRLEEAKHELEDLIREATDALAYVPTSSYLKDDNVRQGQRLYAAIQDVPAAADGSNAPPNPVYWLDIGSIASTANALAVQVQKNTADISEVDGRVTAQAASMQALQASWRDDDGEGDLADALRGWDSTASFAQEVRVRASENEATVTRLTSLDAQVENNKAGITALETVVATDRAATASRIDQLKTEVDGNTSHIQRVDEAQATTDQVVASMRTSVEAVYTAGRDDNGEGDLSSALEAWKSAAKFASETKVLADADQVLARKTESLEVSMSETTAAVQTIAQAQVDADGRASTMWAVKMQLNSQGKYVVAGIGLGIENGPAGLQSQFIVNADRFAVVNDINGAPVSFFAIQGGQTFIEAAFIQDGTITNAKIGSFIASTNYVAGVQGWRLNKDGTFEINGTIAGQGRTMITHRSYRVWDENNVKRVQLGDLTE